MNLKNSIFIIFALIVSTSALKAQEHNNNNDNLKTTDFKSMNIGNFSIRCSEGPHTSKLRSLPSYTYYNFVNLSWVEGKFTYQEYSASVNQPHKWSQEVASQFLNYNQGGKSIFEIESFSRLYEGKKIGVVKLYVDASNEGELFIQFLPNTFTYGNFTIQTSELESTLSLSISSFNNGKMFDSYSKNWNDCVLLNQHGSTSGWPWIDE